MITRLELNRATLARQMLFRRADMAVVDAVERLGGLQAQEPKPPFVGLWSRLADFRREDLLTAVQDRQIVRVTSMRATLHLMSTPDYLQFRPCLQPMLDGAIQSILKNRGAGIDVDAFVEEARRHFARGEATFNQLRDALAKTNPDIDIRAGAYAARLRLPLVQAPDNSTWGWDNDPPFTLAEHWLGPLAPNNGGTETWFGDLDGLVLRYLGAFGPASTADFQAWSGLKGAKEVFERLRPRLAAFRDESKRELFDLPDAPRPGGDVPCPVRFLPDFDSLMLAHADRSRVIDDEHRKRVATANLRILATFLVDGRVAGTWKVDAKKKAARLMLQPFVSIAKGAVEELVDEGERLLRFVAPEANGYAVEVGSDA